MIHQISHHQKSHVQNIKYNIVYATTVNQPQIISSARFSDNNNNTENMKQQYHRNNEGSEPICAGYDFQFEEEKSNRKRPKTPFKRKKMFEEIY